MSMCQSTPIANLEELRVHLQYAMGLELTTIPLYLCALYSIRDGENTAAAGVIRSVVMEEMLHMVLAANVLNGIGGVPSTDLITGPDAGDPIPHYPTGFQFIPTLPTLHLQRFSPEAMKVFMAIEHPADPNAKAEKDTYGSIGAFYAAIEAAIADPAICPDSLFEQANKDRGHCQITPEQYYGGAGRIVVVHDRASALFALREIVRQGEGISQEVMKQTAKQHCIATGPRLATAEDDESVSVEDGDVLPDGWRLYSHFARFVEIDEGRRFRSDQLIGEAPRGDLLPVDWSAVHPMALDPSVDKYAGTEVVGTLEHFNGVYTRLIDRLYASFNGEPEALGKAVTVMWELKYAGVALMKTPSPLASGQTVGPSFEYLRTS